MSLLIKTDKCTFLDHRDYISKVYRGLGNYREPLPIFTLKSSLFCIKTQKKDKLDNIKNRKRPHSSEDILKETKDVQQLFERFKQTIPKSLKDNIKSKYDVLEPKSVRDLAQKLFEQTQFQHEGCSGTVEASSPMRVAVQNDGYFFMPARSSFYCGDVVEQCGKLQGGQFDLMVADPPWWNKYIRRLKGANQTLSYKMMYNEAIACIPVAPLLGEHCLVAVWCTNAASNVTAVRNTIFPAWGVHYVTTWYWLKVTIDLEPLCEFSAGCKKQPYERLILGKKGHINEVPQTHMFMSVPSALHSHKPPLLDLLSPYVRSAGAPRVLELFARYPLPDTTSVGLEPLKWAHETLYERAHWGRWR